MPSGQGNCSTARATSGCVLVRNLCSVAKVDAAYKPLIASAVDAFRSVFTDDLLDVRLLGSVPRGEAIVGESDLDFVALVRRPPSPGALDSLRSFETQLQQEHPIVPWVDLEACALEDLPEVRKLILSSDSISLIGPDTLTQSSQWVERGHLVELVTPDVLRSPEAYRAAVEAIDESERAQIRRYARIVGKDILKGLRGVALRRGAEYERNVERICSQVIEYVPECEQLARRLYTLYRHPLTDKAALLSFLDDVNASLDVGR